jgi:flagellar basal body P-ring protein FlgI
MKAKIEGIGAAIDAINAKKIVVPFESEAVEKIDEIEEKLNEIAQRRTSVTVDAEEVTIAKAKAEELLSKLLEIENLGVIKVRIETEGI